MHRYPYREEGNPPVLRPTLDVGLSFENCEWRTRALVDTGAPITVFDYGTAEALNVRFGHAGAQTATIALLGGRRTVQFEYVDLSLLHGDPVSWCARVAFVLDPAFEMSFQGILGTEGFLDQFAVVFNKYYDYFVVQPPDDAAV